MARVSVIMGIYNSKSYEYLEVALNSILNQTYADFELIICDDGSTNDCVSWAKEIVKGDPRVKFIANEINSGLPFTLNHCLKVATGEYIARMDDDDICSTERLAKQMAFLELHPEYDIVGTNANICDENGVIWGEYLLEEIPTKKSFLWNSPIIHASTVMKKSSLDEVNGYRVSKETMRCEDYDLFMRMFARGMKAYTIQEKLYDIRVVNDSTKKHRPMKTRIEEAIVRYKGFKEMGILIKGLPFIIKPILIGLIPAKLFAKIKENQY